MLLLSTSPVTNRSIGTDKDVAFTGSGELDNGCTFSINTLLRCLCSIFILHSLTMGSLGTLKTGYNHGGAGGKFDEEVPQAYEQTSDAQGNSADLVGNQMDSGALQYTSPAIDIAG